MFSWFSEKPKSSLPGPSLMDSQRSKQIESLKAFNHNVSEIQRDTEYRVNIYNQGTTLSLYLTLPPRFPADKPQVKISPSVRHPWVDELMIITGSQSINNFSVHSDLGKVVKEIVDEFTRTPPTLLQQPYIGAQRYMPYNIPSPTAGSSTSNSASNQPSYPGYPSSTLPSYVSQVPMPTLPPIYSSSTSAPIQPPMSSTTSVSYQPPISKYEPPLISSNITAPATNTGVADAMYKMPDVPISFSQLIELSSTELQSLLEDEEKQEDLVSKLPQIKQVYQDMQTLTHNNEHLARENLKHKSVLEERKRNILEKYDQLNELHDMFGTQSGIQKELLQNYKGQVIQDRLKIAASQAEEEAETIADKFLEGQINLEDFKKQYMPIRTLSHLRKAKEEKLHTVLLQYRT